MKINADLNQRAVVESESLDWVASPLPGVERRMLERDGEEVARVTSIVRYAPKSYFAEHTHGGGEEFLVLEGVFSDQYGDFPAGTYVRNPVGSKHEPHSEEGCIILVKLWWMDPEDQAFVRIDSGDDALWKEETPGRSTLRLHRFADEEDRMIRLAAGGTLDARDLPGGEEIFIIEGACADRNGHYPKGTWLRQPIGAAPALWSERGCTLYIKRGHLKSPPPGPPTAT